MSLAASWCYDGKTWGSEGGSGSMILASKGKVSEVRSDVSSTKYTYDSAGRVRQSMQATPPSMAAPYAFTYDYYLNGSLASATYPSQRRVTQCYDALGRISWVSKDKQASACTSGAANPAASQAYATNVQYAGNGGATQIQYGNGLYESATYNGRQQIQTMGLGTGAGLTDLWQVQNGYGASGNNGNVQSVTLQVPGVVSGQTTVIATAFKYDNVNRLQRVVEDGTIDSPCAAGNGRWCQEFGYDARGNRSMAAEAGLGTTAYPSQFGSNNRIADTGWVYDGRGNLKQAPIQPAAPDKYLYDGEDRLMTYCSQTTGSCADQQVSLGRTVYRYDAEGRRVEKEDSSGVTVFVYDASGNLAAEYGSVPGAGTQYLTGDHLGSIRVVTDGGQAVVARTDYEPFGRELLVSPGDPRYGITAYGQVGTRLKFTSKERDSETGLDYFGARYFSGAQGRFTSVDPIWITKERMLDPQRLNLYAYGRNNPIRYIDPDGMDVTLGKCALGSTQECFERVQQGLRQEDREHVHLVEGNGKNGFKKGEYGVTLDADYKSDSKNFQTLQKLAGDHSATASIDVLKPDEKFDVRVTVSVNRVTGAEQTATMSTTPSEGGGFGGYTLYPQGQGVPGPWTTGNFTDVVINAGRLWIPSSIHHELRHVLLGDFGRVAPYGQHGTGRVDQETTEAEKEAVKNQVEVIRNQQ